MKRIALASLLTLSTLFPALGAEGWMTDIEAAKKKAAEEKKSLLLDFTGSDWCPPCIALREEVLSQEVFAKGVADQYVLVELDFPQDEALITEELLAQNEKLADLYGITGFPTIILTDAQGRPYAMTGYREGGAQAYLAHLKTLGDNLSKRDAAMAKAAKAEGKEKAGALEAMFAAVPRESIEGFYSAEFEELAKLNAESPLVAEYRKEAAAEKQREELDALGQEGKFDELVARVDAIVAEQKLTGEDLQNIYVYKVGALAQQERFMDAVAALDAVITAGPETELGKGAAKYKLQMLVMAAEAQKAKNAEESGEAPAAPTPSAPPATPAAPVEQPEPAKETGKTGTPAASQAVEAPRPVSVPVKVVVATEAPPAPEQKGRKQVAEQEKEQKQEKGGQGKKEGREEAPAGKEAGSGDGDLQKGLEKARRHHQETVAKVNGSHEVHEKIAKDLEAQRQKVKAMEAELAGAKNKIGAMEQKLAEAEKAHNAAHAEEEAAKKAIAEHEEELERRKQIGELEKQAQELQKKAEALRKKAEELKK